MNEVKHNLNESYLQTLTEEERVRQKSEWTIEEQEQYFCPNGTMGLEEVINYIKNKACQIAKDKYGDNI